VVHFVVIVVVWPLFSIQKKTDVNLVLRPQKEEKNAPA